MMKKFWYLTSYGLKKRFKTKSFIISNIVIFILLLLIFNLDLVVSFFGGDFDDKVKVYVVDNTDGIYDSFKTNVDNMTSMVEAGNLELSNSDKKIDELKETIVDTSDIIVEFNNDETNYLSAKVIVETSINDTTYQILLQSINNTKYEKALKESNIDIEELNKIASPANIEKVILDESKGSSEEQEELIFSFIFPAIILPFFMLTILLVQYIGGEINEEKTTRSMEVIISNVPPKVHFYSKLLANNAFIIIQALMWILFAVIGFVVRSLISAGSGNVSDFLSNLGEALSKLEIANQFYIVIPLIIVVIILSFIAYSLLSGILASMTVNPEDFQSIQVPIMIIGMISYYLATMSSMFDGSIFIKVLSYLPLFSFLLSPALLLIGQICIIDMVISIVVLVVFDLVVTKYGLRIYKVGVLNYSTDKLWKRIFKATKM